MLKQLIKYDETIPKAYAPTDSTFIGCISRKNRWLSYHETLTKNLLDQCN